MSIITTGDYAKIPVTLKRDGATFTISGTAIIKAILTDVDRITVISAEVTIDNTATGTDLANSRVIIEFTKAETETITQLGDAILEVQVAETAEEPETWTDKDILIRKGNIA